MSATPRTLTGVELRVDASLPPFEETYDYEILRAVEEAMSVAADDSTRSYRPRDNIHSDEEVAEMEGLSGRIAPGAVLVNWVSQLMVEHFGMGYIGSGGLFLKFIAPVFEGQRVRVDATVTSIVASDGGGRKVTVEVRVTSGSDATLFGVGTAEAIVAER